jgi:LPXTG-motif cell wall-anchored protein
MSISARVGLTPECVPTGTEVAITTAQSAVLLPATGPGSSSTALWAVGAVALAAGGYYWWSHR